MTLLGFILFIAFIAAGGIGFVQASTRVEGYLAILTGIGLGSAAATIVTILAQILAGEEHDE